MEIQELNNRIPSKLREMTQVEGNNYSPSLYHKLNLKCDILFVGMNPSAPENQDIPDLDANISIEQIMEREQKMIHGIGPNKEGQYKKYFGLFNKFTDITGLEWEHIDLFHLRHTKQSDINNYLDVNTKLINFELKLFSDVLNTFQTKVVFVNNKKAGELIQSFFNLEFDSENEWYLNEKKTDKIFILEKY